MPSVKAPTLQVLKMEHKRRIGLCCIALSLQRTCANGFIVLINMITSMLMQLKGA
jgi:hypothetical protein